MRSPLGVAFVRVFCSVLTCGAFAHAVYGCGAASSLEDSDRRHDSAGVDGSAGSPPVQLDATVALPEAAAPPDAGTCVGPACRDSGPSECGCVTAAGACVSGTDANACGAEGSACVACAAGQTCLAGGCAGSAVLFGGYSGTRPAEWPEDTWLFDGAAWSRLTVKGPRGRDSHAMATLGREIVLFGGEDGWRSLSDTWIFDGRSWREIAASGPTARWGHAMAALGNHVVLFGGARISADGGAAEVLADTWVFDGSTWREVHAPGPPARQGHAMATLRDKVVLFGGVQCRPDPACALGDTWTFDGERWVEITGPGPAATGWPVLSAHRGRRLVLFGGDPTWSFEGTHWNEVAGSGKVRPFYADIGGQIAVPLGGAIVAYEGVDREYVGDSTYPTALFDGQGWLVSRPPGPGERVLHAMATLP